VPGIQMAFELLSSKRSIQMQETLRVLMAKTLLILGPKTQGAMQQLQMQQQQLISQLQLVQQRILLVS
jgi:hypothetical protein